MKKLKTKAPTLGGNKPAPNRRLGTLHNISASKTQTSVFQLECSPAQKRELLALALIASKDLTVDDLLYQTQGKMSNGFKAMFIGAFVRRRLEEYVNIHEAGLKAEKARQKRRATTEKTSQKCSKTGKNSRSEPKSGVNRQTTQAKVTGKRASSL